MIEYALFILGVVGLVPLYPFDGNGVEALFLLVTLFAGLHVFHLYDGKQANYFVTLFAFSGIISSVFLFDTTPTHEIYLLSLLIFTLIAFLALRLKKDFAQG
jgi:hypothetical protein